MANNEEFKGAHDFRLSASDDIRFNSRTADGLIDVNRWSDWADHEFPSRPVTFPILSRGRMMPRESRNVQGAKSRNLSSSYLENAESNAPLALHPVSATGSGEGGKPNLFYKGHWAKCKKTLCTHSGIRKSTPNSRKHMVQHLLGKYKRLCQIQENLRVN